MLAHLKIEELDIAALHAWIDDAQKSLGELDGLIHRTWFEPSATPNGNLHTQDGRAVAGADERVANDSAAERVYRSFAPKREGHAMFKASGLIVVGLLVGLAVASVLPGDDVASEGPASDFFSSAPQAVTPDAVAGLRDALRSETQARLALEERIEALSAELAALREERDARAGREALSAAAAGLGGQPPRAARLLRGVEQRDVLGTYGPLPNGGQTVSVEEIRAREAEREIERLVEAGFTRDRAEYIRRRSDELQYEVMQAQYEARRAGQPVDTVPTRDQRLRRDLGDAEYEQLLRATGRLTDVDVVSVFPGSPAESGGLLPGDRIVSYAGTRLLEIDELNQLIAQGSPGETVIVEVIRGGQPMQLAMPRGPLGVRIQGSRRDGDAGTPDGARGNRGR